MLYAATTFWLMIVVLSAWAVHRLWSEMAKPRIVNIILLPGTLVAQMGHVLGLLVTGATVTNTTLIKDDETGDPEQTPEPKPRIPFIGPVVIGMLPLLMCALAIFAVTSFLGGTTVSSLGTGQLDKALPLGLSGFWQLLHHQLDLMESTLNTVLQSNLYNWRVPLFVYLVVCLTVRMAPFPGNVRGSLGAIVVLGVITAISGTLFGVTRNIIESSWSVLSLSVSTLLLLLVFTLIIRGVVALVQLLLNKG